MRAFDMQSELILTCFANRLVATWQTVRIHSQPAADCATQLRWNVFLGERAAWILACHRREGTWNMEQGNQPNNLSQSWSDFESCHCVRPRAYPMIRVADFTPFREQ